MIKITSETQIEGFKKYYNTYAECPAGRKDFFGKPLKCKLSLQNIDNPPIPCVNDSDFEWCPKWQEIVHEIQRRLQ